jgi:ribosomal protein S26
MRDGAVNCTECGKRIPKERLEILPQTKFCVNCSTEKAVVGFINCSDKTSDIIIVNQEDAERLIELSRPRS